MRSFVAVIRFRAVAAHVAAPHLEILEMEVDALEHRAGELRPGMDSGEEVPVATGCLVVVLWIAGGAERSAPARPGAEAGGAIRLVPVGVPAPIPVLVHRLAHR